MKEEKIAAPAKNDITAKAAKNRRSELLQLSELMKALNSKPKMYD